MFPMPTAVAGGGAYCEVVIGRRVEGEFSLHLACDIQYRPHPASLPLHGWTEVHPLPSQQVH